MWMIPRIFGKDIPSSRSCKVCRAGYIREAWEEERTLGERLDRRKRNRNLRSFKTKAAGLQQSAAKGCLTCKILNDGLSHYREHWSQVREGSDVEFEIQPGGKTLVVTASWWGVGYRQSPDNWTFRIEFYHAPGDNGPRPFGPAYNATHIAHESGSEQCLSKLKAWTEDCMNNHAVCQRPQYTPKRLVDVGLPGSDYIKLTEPGAEEVSKYLTLSHRRQKDEIIQTTVENIENMKTRIPLSQLSRTFLDAVAITRYLRQQYLWIDSLCIIQGDDDDWAMESRKMALIYSNSYLTIAASSAENDSVGLFNRRPNVSYRLEEPNLPDYPVNLYVRPSLPDGHHRQYMIIDPTLAPGFQPYCLLTRGWTFQERHLSPRIVHYTPFELIYECKESLQCECTWRDPRYQVLPPSAGLFDDMQGSLNSQAERFMHPAEFKGAWHNIISSYSHTNLTRQADVLPALSGLASAFGARAQLGSYCAGIWEHSLPSDILWRVEDGSTLADGYLAPTWSWAAVKGKVSWGKRRGQQLYWENDSGLRMVRVECLPKTTHNVFGEVSSGSITLQAAVIPAKVVCQSQTNENAYLNQPRRWITLRALRELTREEEEAHRKLPPDPLGQGPQSAMGELYLELDVAWSSEEHRRSKDRVIHCMKVASNRHDLHVEGLVLELIQRQPQEYKRLGWFTTQAHYLFPKEETENYKTITIV